MPNALPTETNATPIVAEVMYELPAVNETMAVIIRVRGRNIDGSNKVNPVIDHGRNNPADFPCTC